MKKLIISIAAVLMIVLAMTAIPALAATDYPTKQVTYLIVFAPGGQSDREARRQQPHLERILKQKVLIDYKAGGGGALGWRELTRANPDGYFIAGFNIPHIILQPLQQEVGYKTEQIVPVAIFQRTPLALIVTTKSQFKTLQEFVEYAVRAIVNHPDDVRTERTVDERGVLITLFINQNNPVCISV